MLKLTFWQKKKKSLKNWRNNHRVICQHSTYTRTSDITIPMFTWWGHGVLVVIQIFCWITFVIPFSKKKNALKSVKPVLSFQSYASKPNSIYKAQNIIFFLKLYKLHWNMGHNHFLALLQKRGKEGTLLRRLWNRIQRGVFFFFFCIS